MNMTEASESIMRMKKALDAVLQRYTEGITVLTMGTPVGKPFSYYESGLEKLIDRVRTLADDAITDLGEIFDDFEATKSDKDFVCQDDDATESDYDQEEEEAEFTEEDEEDEEYHEDHEDHEEDNSDHPDTIDISD